ncbi:MAG: hypothetical protein BMS9Abin05_2153 [Rhodothermia bacterium]|nr:MAG: hypothetical protein BMS9Abin05_2153 [Rhodothermia bacterium]
MPELDANVARYHFEASELPDDTFSVVSFTGQEKISGLFRFEIQLVSDDPQISYDDVVNKRAKFIMMRLGEKVPISGIVSELKQGPRVKEYYHYTAVLVPSLWRLTLNYGSRIFQKMKVDEIVKQIFDDSGIAPNDFRFDLKRSLKPREYCVQHQESDFNFISRLLEHEGICFFFEFDEDRDRVVIVDDRQKHTEIDGEDTITFHEGAGLRPTNVEAVFSFAPCHQIVTGTVVLNDYNYRTPQVSLKVESKINGDMPGEHYEYGNHFEDSSSGNELAKIRNEEIECQRVVISGESVCMGFRSGFLFTLEDHFRDDLNEEEYLLVELEHHGSQKRALAMELGFRLSDEEEPEEEDILYGNQFYCIPASVQFRPARITAKPKVSGIMTGKVESAGGDYAYIDEEGRYRAKMHFDVETAGTAEATRPIRMSQPHAGPDYGMHFPLHANAEVVWACVNGDVDRPIIIGGIPNPSQKSPSVAENKMQNVVRTKSGNQLIMDDTLEKAQILINTPDANRMIFDDDEDNITIETTNKHKITLDDKNKRIEVKTTNGHFVLMQDGENANGGKITVQSEAGHRISINDMDKLITLVDESGDNIFQIDIGNKKLTIKTEEGDIEMLAEQGTIDIKAKTLNIETSEDTNITANNIKSEASMDHEMKASNIKMDASMNFEQQAGVDLKSEAGVNHSISGLQVKSEGSVQNDVAGAMVNVKASAINTIQGSLVKIN